MADRLAGLSARRGMLNVALPVDRHGAGPATRCRICFGANRQGGWIRFAHHRLPLAHSWEVSCPIAAGPPVHGPAESFSCLAQALIVRYPETGLAIIMDESSRPSLYRAIHADILGHILDGSWPPGHSIPTEAELGRTWNCSRMTVNKALSQLATEGFIERRRRAGSVVALPRAQSAVLDIHDIAVEVGRLHLAYGYELLACSERMAMPGDPHFSPGEALLDVTALHLAGERPFCLEQRQISLGAVPAAGEAPFDTMPPGSWLLARVPWTEAEHVIGATGASQQVADVLDVTPGAACLEITRRTWNGTGPITQVRLTYAGTSHTVTARFTPGAEES